MATSRYSVVIQEIADSVAANNAILQAAETENRPLTLEETATFDATLAVIDERQREKAMLERQREAARSLQGSPLVLPGDVQVRPGVNRAAEKPWGYDLGVRLITKPDGSQAFGGVKAAADIALGEFLQAVAHANTPGDRRVDPRLYNAAASGGSTGVPSDGGFLVGTDFSMMLFDDAMQSAVLAPRCRQVTIGANSDGIEAPYIDETSRVNGSRWGGVRVYRRAEADTVTAAKPTLAMFELRLADLMGIAYVTDRLVQDAAALGQVYRSAFASEFAFKIDDEIVRGTGVGECQGILTADATVSVAKETAQVADTVLFENIVNMRARMWPKSRARGIWFVNVEVEPQLQQMSINLGTGGVPVYLPSGGLSATPYGSLFGNSVVPIEHAEELGTVGDVMFLDLNEYMLITKGGIDFAESMHVRFIYGENTFRWTQRINGKPIWRSALTPYQGTNTLSPFVTLATRA